MNSDFKKLSKQYRRYMQGKNANPGQTRENANSGHKGRFFYISKDDELTDYFRKLINRI